MVMRRTYPCTLVLCIRSGVTPRPWQQVLCNTRARSLQSRYERDKCLSHVRDIRALEPNFLIRSPRLNNLPAAFLLYLYLNWSRFFLFPVHPIKQPSDQLSTALSSGLSEGHNKHQCIKWSGYSSSMHHPLFRGFERDPIAGIPTLQIGAQPMDLLITWAR